MRLLRFAVIALPLALAACDLPGLLAVGVKSYENRPSAQAKPADSSSAPATTTKADPAPPPPPTSAVPRREPITSEPLK